MYGKSLITVEKCCLLYSKLYLCCSTKDQPYTHKHGNLVKRNFALCLRQVADCQISQKKHNDKTLTNMVTNMVAIMREVPVKAKNNFFSYIWVDVSFNMFKFK